MKTATFTKKEYESEIDYIYDAVEQSPDSCLQRHPDLSE